MISISTANVNLIKELSKNILKAQTYYREAIENFNNNEKLLVNGIELYKYFVDVPKIKKNMEEIIHINPKNKSIIARYHL